MRRQITILALGLIICVLPACGFLGTPQVEQTPMPPTTPPEPTAPLKTYGLNELVTVQDWDLAIQKVDPIGQRLAWSQFSNTIPATGTWVVIIVDMKNISQQPKPVTPENFTLRSGTTIYPMADPKYVAGYSEARRGWRFGEPVPPGKSVSFYTIYDLPPTAKGLLLTFNHDTNPTFAVGNATR